MKISTIITDNKKLNQELTCCFTGHRPQSLPWKFNENDPRCQNLKMKLKETIIECIQKGYTQFLTGMALGIDQIASEIVLNLKKEYPQIKLIAILPCINQSSVWKNQKMVNRYQLILEQCDDVITLSDEYTTSCLMERNHYMIDHADVVIAIWNEKYTSGTGKTISYAQRQNKKMIVINPFKIDSES